MPRGGSRGRQDPGPLMEEVAVEVEVEELDVGDAGVAAVTVDDG